MTIGYLKAFWEMLKKRVENGQDLAHLTVPEIFIYALRQAWHLKTKTFTGGIDALKCSGDRLLSLETQYGVLFIPDTLKRGDLNMLLREAFDKKHWHQYDISDTRVESGDTILDCGCAEAAWSLSIVRRAGKIHLIEPQIAFHSGLVRTFAPYREKVVIHTCALGNKDGYCQMSEGLSISSGVTLTKGRGIPIHKIDTLFRDEKIDFIKGDLEGFEMEVLMGARETIRKNRPKIAITVYHPENDWHQMKDYLLSLVPEYRWKLKGMVYWGKPMILHAWVDKGGRD